MAVSALTPLLLVLFSLFLALGGRLLTLGGVLGKSPVCRRFAESQQDEEGIQHLPVCASESDGLDALDKFVHILETREHFSDAQDTLVFEAAVGLSDERRPVGAHQTQAENRNIQGAVSERHVGDVAGSNVWVGRHEIKRMDGSVRKGLCDLRLSAAEITHSVMCGEFANVFHHLVEGIDWPLEHLPTIAIVILVEERWILLERHEALGRRVCVELLIQVAEPASLEPFLRLSLEG
mmetsp:Transcript_9648/g.23593  ORF Transcript_9648/g.23593 Transcript_9648/m.23593 type:complete len:236 (-) Transcript_9648:142-849(-)